MSYSKDFKAYSKKELHREIDCYYTAHGNQCERIKYLELFNSYESHKSSTIKAKSIESFLNEIKSGKELIFETVLHYCLNGTNITFKKDYSSSNVLQVTALSEVDGKLLVELNKNILSGITIGTYNEFALKGIKWLIKDPSIKTLSLSNDLSKITKLLKFNLHLETINSSRLTFTNTSKTPLLCRVRMLKKLTITMVEVQSKQEEMKFFKSLKYLPNLKNFVFTHCPVPGYTEISYKCTLQSDITYSSHAKLLNIWQPTGDVECSIFLRGKFNKLFCKYAISKVFSSMTKLYELGLCWKFFKEKRALKSKLRKRSKLVPLSTTNTVSPVAPFLGTIHNNPVLNSALPAAHRMELLTAFPQNIGSFHPIAAPMPGNHVYFDPRPFVNNTELTEPDHENNDFFSHR